MKKDEIYANAFKEAYIVLNNLDSELIRCIPEKFFAFLKDNMNNSYEVKIDTSIALDNQELLPETEEILSLVFRNYLATSEEKEKFAIKDKEKFAKLEEKNRSSIKNIDEIFKKNNSTSNVTLTNDVIVISKESFLTRIIRKIRSIFAKK